ncbi:exopolysaccharide biosynthesis polyprenyl glycosylphosphotransferase [Halomicrobium zhouii]|uniref:Exopolysaccharide biosynthesis polyprenyl glycosylphosphotransferase n=1 Tax=Halomicrobium zhouii TaxID=767519 RepID=A0A1I6KFY3_9EURY|nr:sugar transferase [Halomicrobium zhouii]SFR90096.1 exopolysaccharide biosynthesis polyprenyl glycosylphosphotransferase [Halomicrobium zhouii]
MGTGLRYRIFAIVGTLALTGIAVTIANHPTVQALTTAVPVLDNLQRATKTNGDLVDEILTTTIIVFAALWPLYKPQPRRILDVIALTHKRTFLAATALATIGYFDWSTRLPRTTLIATVAILGLVLPIWFVSIRRRPLSPTRAVIVGDDHSTIKRLYDAAEMSILGYVSPASVTPDNNPMINARITDGGVTTDTAPARSRLGGLSKLGDVLIEHDVDTVLLAFDKPDREEFFGTLSTCHRHGVRALVHRDHAESVLVADATGDELVDTDLEPWDWQDYMVKRVFDFAFAAVGLLALSPFIALIAIGIKLDSPGPVLYSQRRTAEFGETFTIYKFRSMVAHAESKTGAVLSQEDAGGVDPRVTRMGKILRKTHLDEIPQLWSVLVGDMSVVGPRPERPELEENIESDVDEWRSRWFVKPGLTGLAQINGITGHDPERKLRYDIEYIRQQSFWFDLKIVTRQIYGVVVDAASIIFGLEDGDEA